MHCCRCGLVAIILAAWNTPVGAQQEATGMEAYIRDAAKANAAAKPSAGSLYTPAGLLADMGRDLRASQINDLVTIVVLDRASALSRGVTSTSRNSDADASITSALGPTNPTTALANLLGLSSSRQMQGQGETSRETVLSTTISARVVDVLPNGYLVLEGEKNIRVNSENQQITVRGVARWSDVGAGNVVNSDRLANLEVKVNGKGAVGDAIKRPNFLYRLLLGILPF